MDDPAGREGLTRASLLLRVALGGGAAAAAALVGVPARSADSAPSEQTDRAILNYLLMLERTQAAFYARARDVALRGELRQYVDVVGAQEQAHVDQLVDALGAAADPPPVLALDAAVADAEHVLATAVALEDLALAGYNGQLPRLTPAGLRTALRIASVEARHAAWARDLAGKVPAPVAADELASEADVRAQLARTDVEVREGP